MIRTAKEQKAYNEAIDECIVCFIRSFSDAFNYPNSGYMSQVETEEKGKWIAEQLIQLKISLPLKVPKNNKKV